MGSVLFVSQIIIPFTITSIICELSKFNGVCY